MKKKSIKMPRLQDVPAGAAAQPTRVANPVNADQVRAQVQQIMQQTRIPARELIHLGDLAQAAIMNPRKYPAYVKFVTDNRIMPADRLRKPDFQFMSMVATIGQVAKQMAESGEIT